MSDPNFTAVVEWAQRDAREKLIQAQLENYPDSRIMTINEVLTEWMNIDRIPYLLSHEKWEQEPGNRVLFTVRDTVDRTESVRWYRDYLEKRRNEYVERVYRNLAFCLQYPVVVFYECGRRNGKYQWRGARFGLEGGEYMSGFGT